MAGPIQQRRLPSSPYFNHDYPSSLGRGDIVWSSYVSLSPAFLMEGVYHVFVTALAVLCFTSFWPLEVPVCCIWRDQRRDRAIGPGVARKICSFSPQLFSRVFGAFLACRLFCLDPFGATCYFLRSSDGDSLLFHSFTDPC